MCFVETNHLLSKVFNLNGGHTGFERWGSKPLCLRTKFEVSLSRDNSLPVLAVAAVFPEVGPGRARQTLPSHAPEARMP